MDDLLRCVAVLREIHKLDKPAEERERVAMLYEALSLIYSRIRQRNQFLLTTATITVMLVFFLPGLLRHVPPEAGYMPLFTIVVTVVIIVLQIRLLWRVLTMTNRSKRKDALMQLMQNPHFRDDFNTVRQIDPIMEHSFNKLVREIETSQRE